MVDSSEFLTGLISKLFEDEITDNPFEIIFANLEQCSACNFIEGEIERNNCMRVIVWDSDKHESIRLQSLIWGSYCCNLEMESDKKRNNCDANEQILNGKFIVKPPPLLLINAARSSFDGSGKVIKTLVVISLVFDISKYLTSHYDCQTEISTYILTGSANYKRSFSISGHYLTYLFFTGWQRSILL